MKVKLMHGDCIKRMKELPDKSIDLILTDPPYGHTPCKWDNFLDFNTMWTELKRIIKDQKTIVLFGIEPFTSKLRLSNLDMYKYDWVWIKNSATGFVNAKMMPMKLFENISVFSNGRICNQSNKKVIFYPQGLKLINEMARSPSKPSNENSYSRPSHSPYYFKKYTNYPKNVLYYSKDGHLRVHPTQKPVALLRYLIRSYTKKNEIVLDFTMGSGSTGVASLIENINFIGVELDKNYYKMAKDRIKNYKSEIR